MDFVPSYHSICDVEVTSIDEQEKIIHWTWFDWLILTCLDVELHKSQNRPQILIFFVS